MTSSRSEPTAGEPALKTRLREELLKYLATSAYLYVCFLAVELYRAAVLDDAGVRFVVAGVAAGKALVLGKFLLIGEAARAGQRLASRTVLHRMVNRTLLLFLALLVLKGIEELIVGAVHGRSVTQTLSEFAGGALPELLASAFLMLLILIPWVIVTELNRTMGRGYFRRLLMGSPAGGPSDSGHE